MRVNGRSLPSTAERADCPSKRCRVAPSSSAQPSLQEENGSIDYKMVDMISKVRVMQLKESTTYRPSAYLNQTAVTAEDRRDLCQWGFDILNVCRVNRCIAVIAIGYFDRFLSHRGLRVVEACLDNQREFQLAFVVSSLLFGGRRP